MSDEIVRMVLSYPYPIRYVWIGNIFSGSDASPKFTAYHWEDADVAIIRDSTAIEQSFRLLPENLRWINRNGN